ncbi:MAG: hypothetical protein O3B05_00555 [archaeon]|jgi:hypothetical protein|nr:hypothetical protein [archaeon]
MFGMGDAGQVILQLERYLADGREEITEVMARDLIDQLRAKSRPEVVDQVHLVKALRLLVDVLLVRGKAKDASKEIKRLHRARRRLEATVRRGDASLLERLTPASEDHLRAMRVRAALGHASAARSALAKAESTRPGQLRGAVEAVEALGDAAGLGKMLTRIATAAGPVVQGAEGAVVVPPTAEDQAVEAERLMAALDRCGGGPLREDLAQQHRAIVDAEAAASARLQAAIESLQPVVDYHEYG